MKFTKYNLVSSNFDPDTGISTVVINTDVGVFQGTSKLHPEEKYTSNFVGCQNAEYRALAKALRAVLRVTRAELKTLVDTYTAMTDHRYCDITSLPCRVMRTKIDEKKEEINTLLATIEQVKKTEKAQFEKYMTIRERLANKR